MGIRKPKLPKEFQADSVKSAESRTTGSMGWQADGARYGLVIHKGQNLPLDHPLVLASPERFRPSTAFPDDRNWGGMRRQSKAEIEAQWNPPRPDWQREHHSIQCGKCGKELGASSVEGLQNEMVEHPGFCKAKKPPSLAYTRQMNNVVALDNLAQQTAAEESEALKEISLREALDKDGL